MSEFPLGYEKIAPTTWVYLSSLLMIGLYFKFDRILSVRNLDLVLLILLAPGLLLVYYGAAHMNAAGETQAQFEANAGPPSDVDSPDPDVAAEAAAGGAAAGRIEAPSSLGSSPQAADSGELVESDGEYARGRAMARSGYIVLFGVCAFWLLRLLSDPMMVRRPLLEPNLSTGGLAFIGIFLFIFLTANVITGQPTASDLEGPHSAVQLVQRRAVDEDDRQVSQHGPGYAVLLK